MSAQVLIAIGTLIAALGGIATGVVALRKVGTENAVAIRTVAVSENDNTIESMSNYIATLRAERTEERLEMRNLQADVSALRGEIRRLSDENLRLLADIQALRSGNVTQQPPL